MSFLRLVIFFGFCGIVIILQTGCSLIHRTAPIFEENTHAYSPGKFVWHDLLTSDVTTAKTFYGQLLDWTFEHVADIQLLNSMTSESAES